MCRIGIRVMSTVVHACGNAWGTRWTSASQRPVRLHRPGTTTRFGSQRRPAPCAHGLYIDNPPSRAPHGRSPSARACSLIDSMAHARIEQQEHSHVHMHTCVATLATGLTRHDEHAYGMSRGLQPRPFCRVDRQLAGASPLCRQARPITGGCRSHAENSIRSTMILKAYAPESAP